MSTTGNLRTESFGPEIFELDSKEFPEPWNFSQWKELDYQHNRLFTWRSSDNQLLSFALFGTAEGDDVAHLFKIVTWGHLRGSEISQDFFKEIIKKLSLEGRRSIYLEVKVNNRRAIRFYEKMGFKILRLSKGFYSSGEDALIMSMTL